MKKRKGFQKGKDNPCFGKKPHNFGKHPSEETRKKLSESHKGYIMPEYQKNKIGDAIRGKKKPPRSEEHRKKIGDCRRGDKSIFWIDGRNQKRYLYPQGWVDDLRDSIRKRDNFICNLCGVHQNELDFGQVKRLDIHHIDYDKNNLNPNNLISLCRRCHVKTNSHRDYWFNFFKKYE